MNRPMRFLVILSALLLCACTAQISSGVIRGSGNITTQDRQVQGVRSVTLATSGELTITLGSQESLRVEADDNLQPYLETQVSNGVLKIATKPNSDVRPSRPMRYALTVKSLEGLVVSSSGNITAPALQADRFTATISSSGNIRLAGLTANSIQVQISSSGNLEIAEGTVKQQTITLSSSGQYKAGSVRSQTAEARLSSSGQATIWVTDRLNANLSSSGNVNYYGKPALTQSTSSSGRLVSLGDK